MRDIDDVLCSLADDPADYERQGGIALFLRHGIEYSLEIADRPGVGLAVTATQADGTRLYVPFLSYVQREVLALPRLAGQIVRALERSWATRPGRFIEGPAEWATGKNTGVWGESGRQLPDLLMQGEPDSVHLVQLMAKAGQGKTALLEHVALDLARKYQPEPYPTPILLPVDLLGRYVGTVEDAIAGSLNNTYLFPGLSQRDVILALRRRWLVLALDGFDELAARVGVRESFLRISELLDQLSGSGTVVLSARESFFDLYRITTAIRTYLQGYSTSVVRLSRWTQSQGIDVFQQAKSKEPETDLRDLLHAFDGDEEIVFHPFFLTRLAILWVTGERFLEASDKATRTARSRYVIETFVQREATEKWTDRDRKPLLDLAGHTAMLGGIAEEMWRSGAFRLTREELELSAEIGLADREVTASHLELIRSRLPHHAALATRGDTWSFVHDRFFDFFLGVRLGELLAREAMGGVKQVLAVKELAPDVIEWVFDRSDVSRQRASGVMRVLNELVADGAEGALGSNAGQLASRILLASSEQAPLEAVGHTFVGEVLTGWTYKHVTFRDCNLWQADLSGTRFEECAIVNCKLADVRVSRDTVLRNTEFVGGTISSVELKDDRHLFSPEGIRRKLEQLGARIRLAGPAVEMADHTESQFTEEMSRCVERFVQMSENSSDIPVDDLEAEFEDVARAVVRIGVSTGLMREVNKQLGGPRRKFVRFKGSRTLFLKGQAGKTGDASIDNFWVELPRRYRQTK